MLTQAQVEKLNQAIDLARLPGQCKYVWGSKPCCVIGQLGSLEGAPVKELSRWDRVGNGHMAAIGTVLESLNPSVLVAYPEKLLKDLQEIWDNGALGEDSQRRDMRSLVLRYATGQEN